MKLFEMEGFLRGKCLPGDMKVNETNAEYLVRKFAELEAKCALQQSKLEAINKLMGVVETVSDIANAGVAELEARCAALAAENAALKEYRPQPGGAAMMEALDAFEAQDDYPEGGMMDAFDILCCKRVKTPATDAFLAEVRAQGVEMFAKQKREEVQTLHPDTFALGSVVASLDMQDNELEDFAAQLRQEAK